MGAWRIVRGSVATGVGDFARWIAKLEGHYRAKTGMTLYPGTLNVWLEEPYDLPPQTIQLDKREYGGEVTVNIAPCRIFGRRAFILRPISRNPAEPAPPKLLEIATDVHLRSTYGLKDGDTVEVDVL
ncbi:MAG: CTP-dependent riboflavin kinase [Planctomycetota bacterium]|nr:CTP-dependent riboflavin kinase [Planctomycetota bacterium]